MHFFCVSVITCGFNRGKTSFVILDVDFLFFKCLSNHLFLFHRKSKSKCKKNKERCSKRLWKEKDKERREKS